MKNLMMILGLGIVLTFYSCGGGDNSKKKSEKEDVQKNSAAKMTEFSNEYLSIELPGHWSISSEFGAHNDEGLSMFTFKAGDSGTDLPEVFNKDQEAIGEVSETVVDGLPAVTRKQKFMQNEMKISRTWLIDDGKNVISFNVAAPENSFDENKAQELIKKVKIKNHYTNDNGNKNTADKIARPAAFPQKTINEISDNFSQNTVLSDEGIENALKALNALNSFKGQVDDNRKAEIADSILAANGIEDFNKLTAEVIPTAFASMTILKLMEKAESPSNEAEGKMAKEMIKAFVSQNKISAADLKYTYDNWDKVKELTKYEEKD
jgi:hypothetical protein